MEIHDLDAFLDYYERVRRRTLRVARCVPRERFEWRPRPGKFSFADVLRHLAALERWMFAENVAGRPSRYPGHGAELADGWEPVFAFVDRMHAETVEILRRLPAGRLGERCRTPAGAEITVWKWLRAMIEHEIHHRGQIYAYLGLLDVPAPPLYGLTSEEVRERSGA